MANNFVVKISGDSKNYQSAIDQAKKSLENFQQQNMSTKAVMKEVTGTLGKYVSVAAAVRGAQEFLTRAINGSNESADVWTATIGSAKSVVENFFSSLATGDFTSFNMGLRTMAQNAYAAQEALDRLGNASMSWNYFQSARMADLTELREIVNDETKSKAEREAALAEMRRIQEELRADAAGYEERALEAMAREMSAATNLDWQNVTREDLERVLRLDLMSLNSSEAEKARLAAQYAEYQAKAEKIWRENSTYSPGSVSPSGVVTQSFYYQTEEQKRKTAEETRALAAGYQDAILYNEILVRKSDDWLKNLISIVQQADNAVRSLRTVDRQIQSAGNSLNKLGSGSASPDKAAMAAFWNSGGFLEDVLSPRKLYSGPIKDIDVPDADLERMFNPLPVIPEDAIENAGRIGAAFDNLISKKSGIRSLSGVWAQLGSAMTGIDIQSLSGEWAQLGSAMTGLGKDALSAAGFIIQAVAASAPAFQTLMSSAAAAAGAEAMAETPTVIGKIAAAATITATMVSLVANLKNLGSYAEGGIIGGQNYTDGITARVSSGEMVINEADQKRLYDSIHTGRFGSGGGSSIITGEQLVTVINNYGRRTGRGEILR